MNSDKKNIFIFRKHFAEGRASDINKLGGKGANLAEMCNLGIPVPPGITISTNVCNYFLEHDSLPKNFKSNLIKYIKKLEKEVGSIFGDANNPLLFSVRSGARQSMPGMMETILNIGLSSRTIPGLIVILLVVYFMYNTLKYNVKKYNLPETWRK